MIRLDQHRFDSPMARDIAQFIPAPGTLALWWLGQAGFALRAGRTCGLIDPYLSDCLARKYRGTEKPHERLMPAPLSPREDWPVDWVLCSHGHSDHMDPEALPAIARRHPQCRFLVPRAVLDKAARIGLPHERLAGLAAGDSLEIGPGLRLDVVASAHEERARDEHGNDLFLGFILRFGDLCLYHAGDCVPYKGLEDTLRPFGIDLALLPVNGRDARRKNLGVPGNFSIEEAVGLCRRLHIAALIAHHFEMFAFNTVERSILRASLERAQSVPSWLLPDARSRVEVRRERQSS